MYDLGLPEDATRTIVLAMTRPRSYLVAEVESWHVEVLLHLRPYCQVRIRASWWGGLGERLLFIFVVVNQSGKRGWGKERGGYVGLLSL